MGQRVSEGRSPFSPDRSHLHHRLLAVGLTHYEAVLVIYAWQIAIVVTAYLLRYESDALVTGLALLFGVGPVAALHVVQARGWRFGGGAGQGTWLARLLERYRGKGLPIQIGVWLLRVTVPLALVSGGVLAGVLSPDVGVVAAAAFVAVLLGLLRVGSDWLLSIGVYVSAALVAYALETSPGAAWHYAYGVNLWFALVAVGIALLLRFTSRRVFVLNPLDFLIVLLALLVPPVLREINPAVAIGGFMLKFVVIAYAGEILLSRDALDRRLVAGGALAGTLLLGLRALL